MANTKVTSNMTEFTAPTIQTFTAGSGTYTKPTAAKWIRVRVVGAGGGGGGFTNITSCYSGSGGGSGGYLDAIIAAPSATYTYAIGAAGTAGAAGTSGAAGAAGGSGFIIVEEYYE